MYLAAILCVIAQSNKSQVQKIAYSEKNISYMYIIKIESFYLYANAL